MIALVGADGAGKSTVIAALRDRLDITVIDRWDVVGDNDFLVDDTRLVRGCTARMPRTPRFLFLMWASVMSTADRTGKGLALLEGYWMKHAASEIAYGLDRSWVEAVVSGFPEPDRVIYLRSDAETAWDRKRGMVLPYECAMDLGCERASFLAHQAKIHRILDDWAVERDWHTVDTRLPFARVVDAVLELIGPSR